jgi:glucokinase
LPNASKANRALLCETQLLAVVFTRLVAEQARHVLAADVGGTHTRLALLREGERVASHTAASAGSDALTSILAEFLDSRGRPPLAAACLGIAGPVIDGAVNVTNLPWQVDTATLRDALGVDRVRLVNDLEATAFGMLHLPPDRFEVLQGGTREKGRGRILVPAAGTGFGLSVLEWDGERHRPRATEAGHTGYAARTEREIALLRHLQQQHGRVSLERVVSGPGLAAIHDFLRAGSGVGEPPGLSSSTDRSAEIARAALAREDPVCEQSLALFCESYGAAVGDAALAQFALGGVLIGGGIAPKILPALREDGFLHAFLDKGRFRSLLETLHVAVCLEPDTALHGASQLALEDTRRREILDAAGQTP